MYLTGWLKTLYSSDRELYRYIKNIFGFYPFNISLYKLALRHKSLALESANGNKVSNERLEYLGDSVLNTAVADFLFMKFPYKNEGFLTEMRSKIVNRSQLNKISVKIGLDNFIQSDIDSRKMPKSINGNAFEAITGAIYLDKGYKFTKQVIIDRIINVHLDIDELEKVENNYKSKLLEWAQKEKKNVEFNLAEETGEGHKRRYKVEVVIDNKPIAGAVDSSIKGAEQLAAFKASEALSI